MKMNKRMILFIVMAILGLLIITTLIILPPSNGEIPAVCDENGTVMPNSINEKTWLDING